MEWKEAVNYGLPTVILAVLLIGLWRMFLWAKSNVVEPIVKAHLELIGVLKETGPKQTMIIGDLLKSNKHQEDLLAGTKNVLEKEVGTLAANQAALVRHQEKVIAIQSLLVHKLKCDEADSK